MHIEFQQSLHDTSLHARYHELMRQDHIWCRRKQQVGFYCNESSESSLSHRLKKCRSMSTSFQPPPPFFICFPNRVGPSTPPKHGGFQCLSFSLTAFACVKPLGMVLEPVVNNEINYQPKNWLAGSQVQQTFLESLENNTKRYCQWSLLAFRKPHLNSTVLIRLKINITIDNPVPYEYKSSLMSTFQVDIFHIFS